tara:strand:+ start:2429 stop:2548 length:120 start_codon:yes stop_codon:yes gene_type:complete
MKRNTWIIIGIIAIFFIKNRNRVSALPKVSGYGGGSGSY